MKNKKPTEVRADFNLWAELAKLAQDDVKMFGRLAKLDKKIRKEYGEPPIINALTIVTTETPKRKVRMRPLEKTYPIGTATAKRKRRKKK